MGLPGAVSPLFCIRSYRLARKAIALPSVRYASWKLRLLQLDVRWMSDSLTNVFMLVSGLLVKPGLVCDIATDYHSGALTDRSSQHLLGQHHVDVAGLY